MSDTSPDVLNSEIFRDLLCVVSWHFVRVVDPDSRNRLVLCEQLYITDCNNESNTLKPYLPEKKTVVVLCLNVHGHPA